MSFRYVVKSLKWATLFLSIASVAVVADTVKPVHRLSPQQQPATQAKPAAAQIVVYKSQREDGSAVFSDRPPSDQRYEVLRFDCFACAVRSPINWHTTPLFERRFARVIEQVASELVLDPALIRAVIHAESAFNPQAISRRGAQGLMQLMPETASMLGVQDPSQPEQNIRAGSLYLQQLLQSFDGDLKLALAAYNAGPGTVRRFGGVPPYAETTAYIERVMILKSRYAGG